MSKMLIPSAAFTDSKPHYELLDGLRGVAALLVVVYHIFEGFAFAGVSNGVSNGLITTLNHGYLAVDFFFLLSGFVISYAYDDRWKTMSTTEFFKRRIIRLQPMLVLGALIGVITFCLQGCEQWDGTSTAALWILLALALTMLMIPAFPGAGYEVRGNGEMFPLNGPTWSLFFEYIGYLLYALIIRRLSNLRLAILAGLLSVAYILFAVFNLSGYGNIGVGWTLDSVNFWGGLLRMLVPFTIGMLLSRYFKPIKVKGAFWICTAILLAIFAVPYLGSSNNLSLNGIYETVVVLVVFPVLVVTGASGRTTDSFSAGFTRLLGDLSYPLYIVHYPVMYLFYAWLIKNEHYTFSDTWLLSTGVILLTIAIAYASLKLYDEPVRKSLAKKFTFSKHKH